MGRFQYMGGRQVQGMAQARPCRSLGAQQARLWRGLRNYYKGWSCRYRRHLQCACFGEIAVVMASLCSAMYITGTLWIGHAQGRALGNPVAHGAAHGAAVDSQVPRSGSLTACGAVLGLGLGQGIGNGCSPEF